MKLPGIKPIDLGPATVRQVIFILALEKMKKDLEKMESKNESKD